MNDRWIWFRNRVLPWFGLVIAVLLLSLAARQAWPMKATLSGITLTAGNPVGTRAKLAQLLIDTTGNGMTPVRSNGSADALNKVDSGEIQCALVQGGLLAAEFTNVRRIASLHVEPLHLLVKPQIYAEVNEHLTGLKGKTINLSVVGSGTHELASDLLAFLRIEKNQFTETNLSYQELADPERAFTDLPDAVFTVSSLPSPVAQDLIDDRGYRLIALPFADSFRLHWFESGLDSTVNRRRTTAADIPAFAYSVDPPRPFEKLESFGTRLELVTHAHLPVAVVDTLCQAVYESDFSTASGQSIDASLIRSESTFPLHPGAQAYLDRLQPVSTGRVIEVTEQLVGIIGAALGGMLFLWQWLKRVRERRRDREFVGCVQRVVEIENTALRFEQDDAMSVSDLESLQNELGEIKTDLIRRYREGYLEGADMLSAFLKHANDASELISRIVLHETAPKSSGKREENGSREPIKPDGE